MSAIRKDAFSCRGIPYLDRSIQATRGNERTLGRPCQDSDWVLMSCICTKKVSRRDVRNFHCLISHERSKTSSIRRHYHSSYLVQLSSCLLIQSWVRVVTSQVSTILSGFIQVMPVPSCSNSIETSSKRKPLSFLYLREGKGVCEDVIACSRIPNRTTYACAYPKMFLAPSEAMREPSGGHRSAFIVVKRAAKQLRYSTLQ